MKGSRGFTLIELLVVIAIIALLMAINHGDSSILGFCDGHSEMRKWRDPFTIERVDKLMTQGVTLYGIEYPPPRQTSDMRYMADGWAFRYKGAR